MIIVTGAAGFIGSAFVWELNNRGIRDIVCVDSLRTDHRWKNLAKRQITDFVLKDDLAEYLKGTKLNSIHAIVHMGANSSTTETDVDSLMRDNFEYTKMLFQFCTEHKVPFIYASSGATYGSGEHGYDDSVDSAKLQPLNPYGYSKVLFDRWALQQKITPPRWYGLKFFNVYGPNEYHKGSMASVVFKAYHEITKSSHLSLFRSHNPEYADGKQLRDFVYVKDCTNWTMEFIEKKTPSGLYNLGFGKARTWLDLAEAAFSTLGKPLKINWIDIPENIRSQYQYFTEAKISKLVDAGFSKPQWSVEKGVADYVGNYLMKEDKYL